MARGSGLSRVAQLVDGDDQRHAQPLQPLGPHPRHGGVQVAVADVQVHDIDLVHVRRQVPDVQPRAGPGRRSDADHAVRQDRVDVGVVVRDRCHPDAVPRCREQLRLRWLCVRHAASRGDVSPRTVEHGHSTTERLDVRAGPRIRAGPGKPSYPVRRRTNPSPTPSSEPACPGRHARGGRSPGRWRKRVRRSAPRGPSPPDRGSRCGRRRSGTPGPGAGGSPWRAAGRTAGTPPRPRPPGGRRRPRPPRQLRPPRHGIPPSSPTDAVREPLGYGARSAAARRPTGGTCWERWGGTRVTPLTLFMSR